MPPADFKQLRLSTIGDVLLIEVMSPDMQGPDRAKEFIAELTAAVNQDPAGPILVDLHRTSYFSSMGYAALFKVVKMAKERQRPIRFCTMHPDVCARRGNRRPSVWSSRPTIVSQVRAGRLRSEEAEQGRVPLLPRNPRLTAQA